MPTKRTTQGTQSCAVAPYGLLLDPPTARWIRAALALRVSSRGNDGDGALGEVLEMVRSFAADEKESIVASRRTETVDREIRELEKVGYFERRRLAKVEKIVAGEPLAGGIYNRMSWESEDV